MKKILLLVMCLPAMLAAQNGVTIKDFSVSAGTVTFNVSWDKDAPNMPEVWSDTVWVFVDYNAGGVMKRLPLTGATLTNPSWEAASITRPNDQGARVVGNAKTADLGSFSATVQLLTATANFSGACVYASNYPPVAEYNISVDNVSISFTGTPPYDLVVNTGSGTVSAQAYSTYNLFAGQTLVSFTDKTGAPGVIKPGYNQPQGGCTFTQPAVVGTFAGFSPGASTFVTLTDERDNKNYTVVKINNRWIMAQNLNYQKNLTWQENSKQPSQTCCSGSLTIGNFWCPGTDGSTSSVQKSCDVWGALYSWETAMMVDGKWTSDLHSSSVWSEPSSYGQLTDAGNEQNHARSDAGLTGGRGICPSSWHVPTDKEWGVILNAIETGTEDHNTGTGYRGTNAGLGAKAKCTCTGSENCAGDAAASWSYNSGTTTGTDDYGFRVLPSGRRYNDGSGFLTRGYCAWFWSSSANSGASAWARYFCYSDYTLNRFTHSRSNGISVRCIRDL